MSVHHSLSPWKTYCGRDLHYVDFTNTIKEVSCKTCKKLYWQYEKEIDEETESINMKESFLESVTEKLRQQAERDSDIAMIIDFIKANLNMREEELINRIADGEYKSVTK